MTGPGERTFAYHRALAPMLWTLLAIGTVELTVVHLVVSHWWPWVALGLSVVSAAALVWLIAAIRSFRRLPVTLNGDWLVMRVGTLRRIHIPRAAIRSVCGERSRAELAASGVANLALLAHPNVVVEVDPPVLWRRRPVRAVAHRLDDAPAFIAALRADQSPPSNAKPNR